MMRDRGLILLTSLFASMLLLFTVTLMVANSNRDLRVVGKSSEAVQQYFLARGACREAAVILPTQTEQWSLLLNGESLVLDAYDPPVTLTLRRDIDHAHLLHLKAQCGSESVSRVLRRSAEAKTLVYGTTKGESNSRIYEMGRNEEMSSADGQPNPWSLLSNPPEVIDCPDRSTAPADPNKILNKADFAGNLYSARYGDNGFALYRFAGSQGWERLPARPALVYDSDTSVRQDFDSNYANGDRQTPVWTASLDGGALWFADNSREGTSVLQKLDLQSEDWTLESPAAFRERKIVDLVSKDGDSVYALLEDDDDRLTLVKRNAGAWASVDTRPTTYVDSNGMTQTTGQLALRQLGLTTEGDLLASSGTLEVNWDTISSKIDGKLDWDSYLTNTDGPSASDPKVRLLPVGDPGSKPFSVTASGKLLINNRLGTPGIDNYTAIDPPATFETDRVEPFFGGGLSGADSETYQTTLEY